MCKTPISEGGNDRGHELSNNEGPHQCMGRPFHEEESVRLRHENQGLRDSCGLKVDNHMKLRVVRNRAETKRQRHIEFVLEESRLDDNGHKRNPDHQRQPK